MAPEAALRRPISAAKAFFVCMLSTKFYLSHYNTEGCKIS